MEAIWQDLKFKARTLFQSWAFILDAGRLRRVPASPRLCVSASLERR
jgi:hypothetical protein